MMPIEKDFLIEFFEHYSGKKYEELNWHEKQTIDFIATIKKEDIPKLHMDISLYDGYPWRIGIEKEGK